MLNGQVVRNTASMPKSWLTEAPESMANDLASMDSDSDIDLDNVNVHNVGNPCMDSIGCTDQACNKKEVPMLLECHPQTVSKAFRQGKLIYYF